MKKKPIAMKSGGNTARRQRSADAKISKKMDADNLPHSEAMQEKKNKAKKLSSMLMGATKKKSGGDFPDLNKDGKVSYADVLEGRGVTKKKSGGMCRGMGKASRGGNYGRMG